MTAFEYRKDDIVGQRTLEVISSARRFNDWMYKTIKPFCRGEIIEIGSGIGNISERFLKAGAFITLSDVSTGYYDLLRSKFSTYPNLQDVCLLDLSENDFDNLYREHLEKYDCLIALNVIEHIEDDRLAIRNCKRLIKLGGTIVILVPARQSLYNLFDKELSHHRRYNKRSLEKLFINEGLEIIQSKYFNAVGILGWYISGRLQKNKSIPQNQMSFYDKLVPFFKIADKLVFNKIGLSVITVGKKIK